jgi:hypothetical protein
MRVFKDGFFVGYADWDYLNDNFRFVPATFETDTAITLRWQKFGKSSDLLTDLLAENKAYIDAATLTAEERREVLAYIKALPNPMDDEPAKEAQPSTEELQQTRDALIREISHLTEMRDRLAKETR